MNYLHGVETVSIEAGARPVSTVKTAVIGLVGFALRGPVNEIVVIRSAAQGEQVFGKSVPNTQIARALIDIFAQTAGATVMVVNCADRGTLQEEQSYTLDANGKVIFLTNTGNARAYPMRDQMTPEVRNATGNTLFIEGVDYTLNDFGEFESINFNTIAPGDDIMVTFRYYDPVDANWDESTIIGNVDEDGYRTGLKCFDLAFNQFGYNPKIIIAPEFSQSDAVATAMLSLAEKVKAICYFDFNAGYLPDYVIGQRGPTGQAFWRTSNDRAELMYPYVYTYDELTNTTDQIGTVLSPMIAGLRAKVDIEEGYWVSHSNHELKGITKPLYTPTWAVNPTESTEANALNEAGINTLALGFGTGVRYWGNRSAAFPTVTHPRNFIVARRVADVIHESLELAMLQFIDKPLNDAIIDDILGTCNSFMRTLIQRGALVDGTAFYDPLDNPPVELAAGHLTITLDFMMPLPMERLAFKSIIDINLLQFQTA